MGVDHHEPIFKLGFENSSEYNATKQLFQEFGWAEFLYKFQGFNDQVSLYFDIGLKECRVYVGDLIMAVSEKSIAWEIGLSIKEEH